MNKILKSKYLLPILLVFAVLMRMEYETFNAKFHSDQEFQIQSAINLLHGHGVCDTYVDANDISKSVDRITTRYPEGFAYFYAFFYKLTGSLFWSIVFIQYLGIFAYFLAWILVWKLFKDYIPKIIPAFFLLLTAFSVCPWWSYGSTDLIGMSFYWLGTVCATYIIFSERKWQYAIFSAFCLFIAFWNKFFYFPVVFLVPIVLFVVAFIKKEKAVMKQTLALLVFLILFVIFAFLIKTPVHNNGNAGVGGMKAGGLFIKHLSQFNLSMFIQAFTDDRIFFTILSKIKLAFLISPVKIFLSLGIAALLLIFSFRFYKKEWKIKQENTPIFYLISISLVTIASTIFILSYLSITKIEENNYSGTNWTYVREIRYFASAYVAILFLSFYFIWADRNKYTGKLHSIFRYFVVCLILIGFLFYPIDKIVQFKYIPKYFTTGDDFLLQQQFTKIEDGRKIKELISENFTKGVRPLYLSTDDRTIIHVELWGAEYAGAVAKDLINLKTTKDVVLLLNIKQDEMDGNSEIAKFCNKHQLQPVLRYQGRNIYKILITPNFQ